MQLNDPIIGDTGILVEVVHVLRNNRTHLAFADQVGDGDMPGIGLGIQQCLPVLEPTLPGLSPDLLGVDEVLEVDGLDLGPQAIGTSEIGNTGFGADAGTRENHCTSAIVDQSPEKYYIGSHN